MQDVPTLTWKTDRQPPCESACSIKLTLARPSDSQSLSFAVPFPFFEDTVTSVPVKPGQIRLHLQKALYEPWPTQFISRWEYAVDRMMPWRYVGDDPLMEISVPLDQQFESFKVVNSPRNVSLSHVRLALCRFFELIVKHNHEFLTIEGPTKETHDVSPAKAHEPDWYVRVHLPIRSDQYGNPFLVLSVFDCNLAPKLVQKGKMSEEKIDLDFKRIFSNESSRTNHIPSITLPHLGASQLFRGLLRLNSTKMLPSQWQEENLPLGENSPWLATFLSPCFSHYPRSVSEIWNEFQIKKRQFNGQKPANTQRHVCSSCQRKDGVSMKICANCKAIYYCDVKCQRAHWGQHKKVCNVSNKRRHSNR